MAALAGLRIDPAYISYVVYVIRYDVRVSESGVSIKRAREHVEAGQARLSEAEKADGWQRTESIAALATAHFTASMAITNILLTDPPQGVDFGD